MRYGHVVDESGEHTDNFVSPMILREKAFEVRMGCQTYRPGVCNKSRDLHCVEDAGDIFRFRIADLKSFMASAVVGLRRNRLDYTAN